MLFSLHARLALAWISLSQIMLVCRASTSQAYSSSRRWIKFRSNFPKTKKAARWKGRLLLKSAFLEALQDLHVLCLPPFWTFDDVELHGLALFQAAETVCLNGREMNKHIFPVFPGNKAVTLRVIEPLHCSLFHVLHAFLVSEFAPF